MRLFGLEITRAKASPSAGALRPPSDRGWFPLVIREPFTGAWQRNLEQRADTVLANTAVFRCVSLISSDIAKLCLDLVQETSEGVYTPAPSTSPFWGVLTKPNHYQNHIQFIESWVISKLTRGNAYVLKERDSRGIVTDLHVLNPDRVTPLISDNGDVYYRLSADYLAGIANEAPTVPASEIIHDRWNCLFHPLVGISPVFACGVAAVQGLRMGWNSSNFFGNGARPSGVLTAPGQITDEIANRLKEHWESGFTGENVGRVAVLGDGLTFVPMTMTAVDAQLIEQLRWTAETICGVFGVPAYMVNVGPQPLNNNVEALSQQYYGQCLQIHVESIELLLEEGLGLPAKYEVEFDLDGLLRMDKASQIDALVKGVGGGVYAPNEARASLNLPPAKGGESPMAQQQQFSLAALAERDRNKPFAKPSAPAPAAGTQGANDNAQQAAAFLTGLRKGLT